MRFIHTEDGYKAEKRILNQTALIEFSEYPTGKYINWYVSFCIYNKRKNINNIFNANAITGRCGMEGVAFALEAIDEFEKYIHRDTVQQRIIVQWSNSLRKRAYIRLLQKKGFKYSTCPIPSEYGHYALIKEVN